MNRRNFLYNSAAASSIFGLPKLLSAWPKSAEAPWRTFEITTSVAIAKPAGTTRIWVPAALTTETPYQKTISNTFHADGAKVSLSNPDAHSASFVYAEFPESAKPLLSITSRVSTRDIAIDLTASTLLMPPSHASLQHFLQPTKLLPTDGIVKSTADEITRNAHSDLEKAHAIYEWIVDNTFRNPKTRGCGLGDIRFMLETRDLGGKCADLNALFVGLCRASGLPARDVYGIRVAKSRLGYKSLGASSEVITKSQHCRAEVYLGEFGWVPADPADVRKVVLEEPPGSLSLNDEPVRKARNRLFGSWEMNWVAFNFAHDLALPGSSHDSLPFLMYPQAETGGQRLDCLDADNFQYEITAKELP